MRKFIIILSFIFYLSAAVITYKAFNISTPQEVSTQKTLSTDHPSIKSIPEEAIKIIPEEATKLISEEAIKSISEESKDKEEISLPTDEEQANDKAVIDELKSTDTNLKKRLTKDEELRAIDKTVTQPVQTERVISTVGGGLFSPGQEVTTDKLKAAVKDIAAKLTAYPDYPIRIEGHTDNLPVSSASSKRYKDNYELSFLRAKAVAFLLEEYGISKERISIVGFGDTHPIATNTTIEGRAQNRRVEIKIISTSK